VWLGNGSSFWSTCFSCFDLVLLWCLLIQCLGATQGIPPSDHFYPFLGSAAQGHLAVLVAYVLYSGGVHVVNTMQCCVSVFTLTCWLAWRLESLLLSVLFDINPQDPCMVYILTYTNIGGILMVNVTIYTSTMDPMGNNPHWLSYSFRPLKILKPPISWSQMDRLWRTAGVSTLCTLSTETKRVGFWHNWGLPKTPVGWWCWWVYGIYMGSMMIILPFKNSGGYRMWDVFVGQGSEGSEFTTVRCTFVVWYILGWPHKQETLLWNWWQRGCLNVMGQTN